MGGFTGGQQKLILISIPAILLLVGVGVASVFPTVTHQGYMPEQPIPFSHKVHAGQYKIPCMYCHVAPERSNHSTIPSMNVCMNCHSVVKVDSPYIQKLREHYEAGEPIEWVRIHEIPDHAHFPHKAHVANAKMACQTCHGPVEQMDRVYQYAPLNMGWCMECHRGESTPRHVLEAKYPELPPAERRGKDVAPTSCSTCHY